MLQLLQNNPHSHSCSYLLTRPHCVSQLLVPRHRGCVLRRSLSVSELGTCEAARFDSISNRTSDSRFDPYWWSYSKFSNRPHCQSSFVKKRLVVVKFAFKVDFGSKISVQQHCLARLWLNWNKQVLSSEFRSPYITLVCHKYKIPLVKLDDN